MESAITPHEAQQALHLAGAARREIYGRYTAPPWAWVLQGLALDAIVMSLAFDSGVAEFAGVVGGFVVVVLVASWVHLRTGIWPSPSHRPEQGRAWSLACGFAVPLFVLVSLQLRGSWPAAPIALGLVAGPVTLTLTVIRDRALRRAGLTRPAAQPQEGRS